MNPSEAKEILQSYRPGTGDAHDPEIKVALDCVRQDPELSLWLSQHTAFQKAMGDKFREIPIPAHLREKILSEAKVVRSTGWWREPVWLRAVASIILLIGVSCGLFAFWKKNEGGDTFAAYQSRMVRSALREYRMDIVTDDLEQVRKLAASRGGPSDFSVPTGLSKLQLTGGGILRWRNNPVTMICFNRGDSEMLFLFVMNESAVQDPPDAKPELVPVNKLLTARWSEGNKTYLLAGPHDAEFMQKYF